jgi:acyl-CoA synthetase (AMP-forming)/AMP-acid ligase II
LKSSGDPFRSSLVGLVAARARERSGQRIFTFLNEEGREEAFCTYAGLDRRARAIAAHLQERGLAGKRALLLFPPGLPFIEAFLGCLYAGVVAVPAYPPRANRGAARLRSS